MKKILFLLLCMSAIVYSQQKQDTLFLRYDDNFLKEAKYEGYENTLHILKNVHQDSEWAYFQEKRRLKKLNSQKIVELKEVLEKSNSIKYLSDNEFKIYDSSLMDYLYYVLEYRFFFLVQEDFFVEVCIVCEME